MKRIVLDGFYEEMLIIWIINRIFAGKLICKV